MTADKPTTTKRCAKRFMGGASATYDALLAFAGIGHRAFYRDSSAGIETFRVGAERVPSPIHPPPPATPYIAYGHLSTLGAELHFPEEGEVGVSPLFNSLDAGISALSRPIDFERAGMAPFYLRYWEEMRAAFPENAVGFLYSASGPLTSAYLLRGSDFLTDLYDAPELAQRFLGVLTDSIVAFNRWKSKILGRPATSPASASLADDIAAMVPPALWDEFVLPFWRRWYKGLTTGLRRLHCENLSQAHLPHLDRLDVDIYDPFVSPQLTPAMIEKNCSVPFQWGLPSFRYGEMDTEAILDFVVDAASHGAEWVYTHLEGVMCTDTTIPKVVFFQEAWDAVRHAMQSGAARGDLSRLCREGALLPAGTERPPK